LSTFQQLYAVTPAADIHLIIKARHGKKSLQSEIIAQIYWQILQPNTCGVVWSSCSSSNSSFACNFIL